MAKKRRRIPGKVKTSSGYESINPLYPLYEKVNISDVITSANQSSISGVIENIH